MKPRLLAFCGLSVIAASTVIPAVSHAETITYGSGDVTSAVRVLGSTGTANDHVVTGNTNVQTGGTSFYLQVGTLTIDGSAGPIRFESSGVADNSASVYLLSRDYGATALDIKGYGQVYFHIDDQYTGAPSTYALFIRGRVLAEGREYVGEIDGINVLTESNGATGLLFSDSTARISNTIVETTGSTTSTAYAADGVFLQFAASINMTDSQVTTRGDSSRGLVTLSSGIVGDNLTVRTYGDEAYGAFHGTTAGSYKGHTYITDSSIETSGRDSIGVLMITSNAIAAGLNEAVYDNTEITTMGDSAHATVVSGENMELGFANGTVIVTEGQDAYGALAARNGYLSVSDSVIESKQAAAIVASTGGQAMVSSSAVKGTVSVAFTDDSLHNSSVSVIGRSAITVDGGTLTATGGPAIIVQRNNAGNTETISGRLVLDNGVQVTSSNGVLLSNNAENSDISVEIVNGTVITGVIDTLASSTALTSLQVDAASSWTMTGDSSMTNFTLEGTWMANADLLLTGTMDFVGGAQVYWTNESLISTGTFNADAVAGKTGFTFSSYYQGMYIVIAEYDDLAIAGTGIDADDYFECKQGRGNFLFTEDNKLVYQMLEPIPEPSSAASVALAALMAGMAGRRRKS